MMAWLLIGVLALVVGVTVGGALSGRRQVGGAPHPQTERLLAEQAERISQLEDELERLREQADFTERLLGERGGGSGTRSSSLPPSVEPPEEPPAG